MIIKFLQRRLNFIIGLIFIVILGFIQNSTITIGYYMILFILEIIYLIKGKTDVVIEQCVLSIPLLGITVSYGIPLSNIYISILTLYLIFIDKSVNFNRRKIQILLMIIFFDLLRCLIFSALKMSASAIIGVPILYLCILCGFTVFEGRTYFELKTFMINFIEGTILSIIYGFMVRFIEGGFESALVNTSIINRNEGASGDPNYYGLYMCISIAFIILMMFLEKKYSIKRFALIFLMIFMGMSSSSRMFYMIASIEIIILLFFMVSRIFNRDWIKIILIFTILIFTIYYCNDIILKNIEYVFSRLDTNDLSELTNGRNDLVKMYMDFMNNDIFKMLFGFGIAQYNIRSGILAYAHNAYIELYIAVGWIGIMVITTSIIYFFIKSLRFKNFKHINLILIIPLIIIMLGGMGVNILEVDCFYLLLGLTYAIMNMDTRNGGEILYE